MKENSIAVLPFENLNLEDEFTFFGRGLADQIVQTLSKIEGLSVISSRASFYLADHKESNYKSIAEFLKVQMLLDGAVMLVGQKVRINLKLIQAKDSFVVWSKTIDKSFDDVFKTLDEISKEVAVGLQENLTHFEMDDSVYERYQISFDVYKKYLEGRYLIYKLDLENMKAGIEILKEVIAVYPDFPYTYLDINQAYIYMGTVGSMKSTTAYKLASPYFEKALLKGKGLPETYLSLGWMACFLKWEFKEAYHHLNKSIQLKQIDSTFVSLANLLFLEGKYQAAHFYIDKALNLNPLSFFNQHFKSLISFNQKKYDEAIKYASKSLAYQNNFSCSHRTIGLSYLLKGWTQKALDFFLSIQDGLLQDFTVKGGMALCYIYLNKYEKVDEIIDELEHGLESEQRDSAVYYLILIYTNYNKLDKAIGLLNLSVTEKISSVLFLFDSPLMKPILENKCFQKLANQIFDFDLTDKVMESKEVKKSLFTQEALLSKKKQLTDFMVNDKPYLDTTISLKNLSDSMQLSVNQMSYLLNEGFEMNFSEFINKYRLQAFKEISGDPKNQQLSILGMAYESGFSSKTVFNTFFKKNMGVTPKVYMSQLKE